MAADPAETPPPPSALNTDVQLTVGQLFYEHKGGFRTCPFQFNPTELERSRTVRATRTPTGNTAEEPRAGGRNRVKRKASRRPEPWSMTLSLKFDASHPMFNQPPPRPVTRSAGDDIASEDEDDGATSDSVPQTPSSTVSTSHTATAGDRASRTKFRYETQRILETMRFFEALAEPRPGAVETDRVANADETPPPPFLTLAFGQRSWLCSVTSVRIKEEDYTYDLWPRRFEVSLNLEIIETVPQVARGRGPAQ